MIQTERLVLRPMSPDDADAVVALLTDAEVGKSYMLPDFETPQQAYKLFDRLCALSKDEFRFVRGIYLDGVWIGMINDVEIKPPCIELGYALLPAYHGRGYATEALHGTIFALLSRGYTEIRAGAFEQNIASIRVMEKNGMRRIDHTEDITYRGETLHCVFYSYQR